MLCVLGFCQSVGIKEQESLFGQDIFLVFVLEVTEDTDGEIGLDG